MDNRILKPNMGRSIWNPGQKPPYGARLNSFHPLSQGLVGAWLFNEGGGNTAFENIYSNHGSLTDGTWSPDKGIYFNGTSSSITVYNSPLFNLTNDWTYAINISNIDYSGTESYLFAHWQNTTTGRNIQIRVLTNGLLQVAVPYIASIMASNSAVPNNGLIVVTKKNTVWSIYFNGVLDRSTDNATAQEAPTSSLEIGRDSAAYSYCLGYLDRPMIWNRALSSAEIASLHANPYQMFDWPVQDFLVGEISAEDFSGWSDLIRNTLKLDYGASTYAGDQLRKTGKYSVGSFPSTGAATKKTTKTFAGIWSSVADLIAQLVGAAQKFYQDCISVLTSSGAVFKKSTHNFSGALTSIATMIRKGIKSLAGSAAFIGDITKFIGKKIIRTLSTLGELLAQKSGIIYQVCLAGLTFSAKSIKSPSTKLSGAIQTISTLIKKSLPKSFSGILNSSAKIIKMPIKLATGTVSFVGKFSKFIYKKIIRTFTTIGDILTQKTGAIYKSLAAGMTFSGRVIKSYSMKLSGVFQDLGAIIKIPLKIIKGGFTTAASVARLRGRILTAILSSTGTIYRKTFTELKSNLNQSGSLIKSINIILISVKSFIGDLLTRVFRTIIGILHHRTYFVPFMDREILLPTDGRTYVIEKDDNTYEINE